MPRVNPSAGETKRVAKVAKAPDTGYIEDISPLHFDVKREYLYVIARRWAYRVITTV